VVLDDLATRFGFQDGTVVPNGVDLGGAAVSRRPAAVPTVFAVGRVERMKGFDLLVDAFARSDLPEDARLVIGGDGEMLGALRDQGRALGLGGRLVLPGMLTSRQVAEQMATATVVVVPSRREAFGIVVLEAWRSGTPVVVTSRGGPARLVTDGVTGLVVDPEDRDALAACLSRLVNDPATADRLGSAGRVAVKAFPWSRVAAEYEQIYDGCVRR
jgi:glycosyltransferase involved in cell wall biosynthesis